MTKKGAIELSMTTIIVIVLGVTLLILGFAFIKGIFGKLEGISSTTFDKANTLLTGLENVEEFLTVTPTMINVEQGKDEVANLKPDIPELLVSLRVNAKNSDPKLKCMLFHETANEDGKSTSPKSISSGEQVAYSLIIKETGGDLRTTGCNIVALVEGVPDDDSRQVVVRIVKPSGLFG